MAKYDTINGSMTNQKRKRFTKSRPIDNHYRTDKDEYEFIARMAYENELSVADYTRRRLLPSNWKSKLVKLRSRQGRDSAFTHPRYQ